MQWRMVRLIGPAVGQDEATADMAIAYAVEVLGRSEDHSRNRTLINELWICRWPLYSIKPNFLNLFMKTLTRERVVPTISASVSWLIGVVTGCGPPSLPKFVSRRSVRASRFSLELKSWSTRSSSTRLLRQGADGVEVWSGRRFVYRYPPPKAEPNSN